MPVFYLSPADWDEFDALYPGCWLWLQQRSLRRELESLKRLTLRDDTQARRLTELTIWAAMVEDAEGQP